MFQSIIFRGTKTISACAVLWSGLTAQNTAFAIGFDSDDFIIASGYADGVGFAVFDDDFTYKGMLGDTPFVAGFGMDFDADGRLVSRGIQTLGTDTRQIVVFEPDGSLATDVTQFVTSPPGVLDLKVSSTGSYIVAGQNEIFGEPNGLLEIAPDGSVIQQLDVGDYEGTAVLPQGVVWGGGGSGVGFLKAFDVTTGNELFAFDSDPSTTTPSFDEGQLGANSMYYSELTSTVLLADRNSGRIYERDLNGGYVAVFDLPEDVPFSSSRQDLLGVTRGPAGDIFAVLNQRVVRWSASGEWIETISVPELGTVYAWNIVWGGNTPGLSLIEGDYNGDGLVSQADLDLVLLNWGSNFAPDGWVVPDLFDQLMSQNELDLVLINWGDGVPPSLSTTPEPSSLTAVFVLGGLSLSRRKFLVRV